MTQAIFSPLDKKYGKLTYTDPLDLINFIQLHASKLISMACNNEMLSWVTVASICSK